MSYASETAADSPQAGWNLDEASGTTAADTTGNSRTLTYSGATLAQAGLHSGSTGSALGGASGQGVASIAWNGAWMSLSTFTVAGWVKPNNASDIKGLFGALSTNGWVVWQRTDRIGIVTVDGGGVQASASGPLITPANPRARHIAARLSGGVMDLFVDGVKVATINVTGTLTATPAFQIGGYAGANYSQARFDGFRYYNTALSDARIAAHHAAGTTRSLTPLVHYALDEPSGTTMADSSGNSNTGTYSGAILGQTALRGSGFAAKGGTSGQGIGNVATTSGSRFDSTDLTIAFNVKCANNTNVKGLISRWNSGGWIVWQNGNTINFYHDNANGGSASTTNDAAGPTISVGTNSRITIAVSSDAAKFYVDGTLVQTRTLTAVRASNAHPLQLGGYNGANYSEATLDDVKVWDTTLSASEVASEYAGSVTGAGVVTAPAATASGAGGVPITSAGAAVAPHATASGEGTVTPAPALLAVQPAAVAFLGDSTGDETGEWAYLVSDEIDAYYPNAEVDFRAYNSGSSTYGSATELANGGGALTTVYNGHVGGTTADYPLAVGGRLAAMVPSGVDVVVLNYGHNHTTESAATFLGKMDTLVAAIEALRPGVQVIVSSQNQQQAPTANPTEHNTRQAAIQAWAAADGYGYIPTYETFIGQASPGSLLEADGVHPTSGVGGGSYLWAFGALTTLFGERPNAMRGPRATASGAGVVTYTGAGAATAPHATASGVATADDTTFATGAVTAPVALASGVGTSTVTGVGAAAAPVATAAGVGTSIPPETGAWTAPVLTDAVWVSSESMGTLPDVSVWAAKVETDARMRLPLVLAAPPLGVLSEWPLERQAHLMPALSAATPRMRPYVDYDIERGEIGRLHVLVGGVDVTYLRDVPARFADYTSSVPFGPASASLSMPQMKPWDEPGTGDLSMFKDDAKVEIAIARPDDSTELVWEGFLASDEDNSGENREDYTFHAEGLFAQAMHEPYDPPVYLPPTDPMWLVADVMNSVTHRRWNKFPRVNSGLPKTTDRGRPGQSKWQRVQDLLSKALTTDGRQWTIARFGPYDYRPALKATTAVADWTVTKGAPGVECSFVVDQATRRDAVYGRGFAPDGGYWEGRVFPGLEFGIPPRYPMNNTALNLDGRSDSTTDTGNGITLWQRKMRELGYPVRVDGVMNSADVKWVTKIQRDRSLTVDGSLGPQTWAATWENNSTEMDLTTYRLPLATLPGVEPWKYSASGARVGKNPADDKSVIRHAMPEVDFGSGIKKSDAIALARIILDREQTPGIQFRVVLTTDPHQPDSSRFDIKAGDNIEVLGHRGVTTGQISEVSVSDLAVTLTVDSKARDSLAVQAILERNEEARRDVSSRTGKTTDGSSLNKSAVVQYESESRAGFVPRTAVNGNSGLWTVRKTFVSQIGVAKVEFDTSPNAELVVALFNRPIRISVLESLIGAPLTSSDGWYDNIEKLQEKYGLMEVFGSDSSPGGYWPRQKGDGALTGKLRDSSSLLYDSPFGGFVWVAMFTSRSTWVEGRVFPATEQ